MGDLIRFNNYKIEIIYIQHIKKQIEIIRKEIIIKGIGKKIIRKEIT